MKKLIALLLAAVMVLALAACGSTATESSAPAGTTSENEAAEATSADNTPTQEQLDAAAEAVEAVTEKLSADGLGGYKVGLYYLPNVEGYGKAMFDYFDWLCDLTNCEPVHYEMTSFASSDIMAAVETLVSQGCDAIICVIGSSPSMFEYLNDNGVYYTLMTRSYTEEVCAVVLDSEYFCGFIGDLGGETGIEYLKGFGCAEALAAEGCKNIAIIMASEGETMNDERTIGMQAAAEKYGMNVLTVVRGGDYATGTSDILASYGDVIDGLCTASIDSSLAALQSADMVGYVKLACVDAPSDPVGFLEAGYCSAFTNEGAGFMALMYMQMFNAMTGADRLFDTDKIVPQFPGIIITSVDTYKLIEAANEKVQGCFTPNEILSLNSIIAPGMSVAEREEMLAGWCTDEYWNIPMITARVNAYADAA